MPTNRTSGSNRCLRRVRCSGEFCLLVSFRLDQELFLARREWLLTKIVNGERASYSAPKFARMQERTRSQMLEDIVANLANHAETGQIPKPYRRGSWRPIGEDPCMLRVTVSCCMRLYVAHSMYFALETLYSTLLSLSVNLCIMICIYCHNDTLLATLSTKQCTNHAPRTTWQTQNSRGIEPPTTVHRFKKALSTVKPHWFDAAHDTSVQPSRFFRCVYCSILSAVTLNSETSRSFYLFLSRFRLSIVCLTLFFFTPTISTLKKTKLNNELLEIGTIRTPYKSHYGLSKML